MPSLFRFSGYCVYFWSQDGNEPIHVHVSKGRPSPDSLKYWLLEDGGVELARKPYGIPERDLRQIAKAIGKRHSDICREWASTFGLEPTFVEPSTRRHIGL